MSLRITFMALVAALPLALAGPAAAQELPMQLCSGPIAAPPGGLDVATYLGLSFGEQRRVVADLREAMLTDGLDDVPSSCAAYWRECLTEYTDDLGQAVAQGYLVGRDALLGEPAYQGVLTAIGLHCAGAWTPGQQDGS